MVCQIPKILTFNVFVEDIINNWINVFVDIFEEEREAIFDSKLQLL